MQKIGQFLDKNQFTVVYVKLFLNNKMTIKFSMTLYDNFFQIVNST